MDYNRRLGRWKEGNAKIVYEVNPCMNARAVRTCVKTVRKNTCTKDMWSDSSSSFPIEFFRDEQNKLPKTIDVLLQGVGRRVPKISPQTNTWEAILTLLNSNANAVAVGPAGNVKEDSPNRRSLAISGYSILSKLSKTSPQDYEAVLSASCADKSLPVGEITSEDDIVSLLHVFDASSFGYALNEDKKTRTFSGIVSLTDLLELYLNGEMESDLIAREVASYPVFSLPKNTTIKETIEQMILQKVRRIRISDTREIVSDREILKFLFNTDRIVSWRKGHFGLLDGSLHHIQTFAPPWVDSDIDLKSAAKALLESKRDCVFCKDGIVTPWDLIMKPWRARRLRLKS